MRLLNVFIYIIIFLLSACSKTPEIIKLSGSTQGTTWHISFWSKKEQNNQTLQTELDAELERIDRILSNYRPDSIISQVNANPSTSDIPSDPELIYLIEEARKVHSATEGCYDLTIRPLFDAWGFSNKTFTIPSDSQLSDIMYEIGMEKVQTHDRSIQKQIPNVHIDVSSIGQGYSVAKLAELLNKKGINNYLVEIGGELQTRGHKPDKQPWRIAIERPLPDATGFQKVVTISTDNPTAIMTSGTYRHYYDKDGKRYSHILDARTGQPVTHSTVSVTVIHESPTVADAWSTALLCLGTEKGLMVANKHQISTLFIDQNNLDIEETSSDAFKQMKNIRAE